MMEIMNDTGAWFNNKGHELWKTQLQVEQTAVIGWLRYSNRHIDVEVMTAAIQLATGLRISLRYQNVYNGRRGLHKEEKVKALHNKVARNKSDEAPIKK
jgi:hypothetical protein